MTLENVLDQLAPSVEVTGKLLTEICFDCFNPDSDVIRTLTTHFMVIEYFAIKMKLQKTL